MVNFSDYLNFVEQSSVFRHYALFELLNEDETVFQTFSASVIGGNLSVNRANGIRRSISINVNNILNTFTPNQLTFWIGQKFKLSLGYMINNEVYYISQGVFGLRNPTTLHERSDKSASITGADKFAYLDGTLGGRLDATYNIPLGTSVKTAISAILSLCDDPVQPLLIIDPTIVTPYTIYKEIGGTFADVLLELNGILSYNMYYDTTGKFVCEPDVLNSEKGSYWDFSTDNRTYLGIDQRFDFENAFNIVQVVGDNVNGNIATGKAKNSDPSSPLSTLNIGNRLAPIITDSAIDTDTRAQDRAVYELKRYGSLAVEASIRCIPLLHLDVDQIITVTDEHELLDRERFLVNSISMPLTPKAGQVMDIGASNATDIDFTIS